MKLYSIWRKCIYCVFLRCAGFQLVSIISQEKMYFGNLSMLRKCSFFEAILRLINSSYLEGNECHNLVFCYRISPEGNLYIDCMFIYAYFLSMPTHNRLMSVGQNDIHKVLFEKTFKS